MDHSVAVMTISKTTRVLVALAIGIIPAVFIYGLAQGWNAGQFMVAWALGALAFMFLAAYALDGKKPKWTERGGMKRSFWDTWPGRGSR